MMMRLMIPCSDDDADAAAAGAGRGSNGQPCDQRAGAHHLPVVGAEAAAAAGRAGPIKCGVEDNTYQNGAKCQSGRGASGRGASSSRRQEWRALRTDGVSEHTARNAGRAV